MKRTLQTIFLAGIATLGLACGARAHITDGFGERSRTIVEMQRASTNTPNDSAIALDSEEAAIIHGQYRSDLGASKATNKNDNARVLVLEPDK